VPAVDRATTGLPRCPSRAPKRSAENWITAARVRRSRCALSSVRERVIWGDPRILKVDALHGGCLLERSGCPTSLVCRLLTRKAMNTTPAALISTTRSAASGQGQRAPGAQASTDGEAREHMNQTMASGVVRLSLFGCTIEVGAVTGVGALSLLGC
jgi:hypothetical protein